MADAAARPQLSQEDLLVAPTAERWRAMSKAERDAFLEASLAALQQEEARLSEGSPHSTAKTAAWQLLRDHFDRVGRPIFIRAELPVHYPGERVFTPDLIAVLDVEDPWMHDERMAWVVAQEGRGVDLALEILHSGDPSKDLLDNVLEYARLGIPEYFIYDRRKLRVLGYRLPFPGSGRYEPIKVHGGKLRSEVLGMELAIIGGRLRFSIGGSAVLDTRELNERLGQALDELELKVEAEAEARLAAERRAEAEGYRAQAEAVARFQAERRAEAEAAARAELERQIAELRARLGEP